MAEIFQLVGEQFLPVPGELLQISLGNGQSVWGINASSEIFRLNTSTGRFEQVPGQLTSISVGRDNIAAVFGINASSDIFHFFPSTGFQLIPGQLTSISVGLATLAWGINKSSDIFIFDIGEGSFEQVQGQLTSISAGADGTVWGINASSGIFRSNASTRSFEHIPGSLASISAAADGTAWGINASSDIFHFVPGTGFQQVPGSLASISAGADGTAWGINRSSEVFRFDPGSGSFKQVPGILNRLVASTDGSVWGINDSGQPFVESDQLDFDFPSVIFDNGVPVGGSIHLTLHRTGDYIFTGNFHDSSDIDIISRDLSFMVGVKDIADNLFSFSPAPGHIDAGSPNYAWNISNHHPLIAQNWRTLAAGHTAKSTQSTSLDLSGLIGTLISAVGTVVKVISIVFGGDPTAPPDDPPDDPNASAAN